MVVAGFAAVLLAASAGAAPVEPPALRTVDDHPILLAAGDIADCASSGDEATAAILDGEPDASVAPPPAPPPSPPGPPPPPPDTTPPDTSIDEAPPARTRSHAAEFAFSSEPCAAFECALAVRVGPGGRAGARVACASGGTMCRGTISIQLLERPSRSAPRRYRALGRAGFSLAPDRRAAVQVTLSRAGLAALGRTGTLRARLLVRTAAATISRPIELRR